MPGNITQHHNVEEVDEEVELVTASPHSTTAGRRFNEDRRNSIETVIDMRGRFTKDGEKDTLPHDPLDGADTSSFKGSVYASNMAEGNSLQHVGNVYNIQNHYRDSALVFQDSGRRAGIHFSLGNRLVSSRRSSARRLRMLYVARKKQPVRKKALGFVGLIS